MGDRDTLIGWPSRSPVAIEIASVVPCGGTAGSSVDEYAAVPGDPAGAVEQPVPTMPVMMAHAHAPRVEARRTVLMSPHNGFRVQVGPVHDVLNEHTDPYANRAIQYQTAEKDRAETLASENYLSSSMESAIVVRSLRAVAPAQADMCTCDASVARYRIRCRRQRACTPGVESLYDRALRAVEKFNAPLKVSTRYRRRWNSRRVPQRRVMHRDLAGRAG